MERRFIITIGLFTSLLLSNCSDFRKDLLFDDNNQLLPHRKVFHQTIEVGDLPSLYLTIYMRDSVWEADDQKHDSLWVKVKNIGTDSIDSLNLVFNLYDGVDHGGSQLIMFRTLYLGTIQVDSTSDSILLFTRVTSELDQMNLEESYWDIVPIVVSGTQTSNSIVGEYEGEMHFFHQGSANALHFSQARALITADRNLDLVITDRPMITMANGSVKLDRIQGTIGSLGDFWGSLITDSSIIISVRGDSVPNTIDVNRQLPMQLLLENSIGTDLIDSISVVLTKK